MVLVSSEAGPDTHDKKPDTEFSLERLDVLKTIGTGKEPQ
jgi:hypothetical protein